MRTLALSAVLAPLTACGSPTHNFAPGDGEAPTAERFVDGRLVTPFRCTLTSDRETYAVGEKLDLAVRLYNETAETLPLIGSLDASDAEWRYPYCAFTVTRDGEPFAPDLGGRCGNMNDLRAEDVVEVAPGAAFDPYERLDSYGFFEHWLFYTALEEPGEYRITFHYSTDTEGEEGFMGDLGWQTEDPKLPAELSALVRRVPRFSISSNEVVVRVE